LGDEERQARYRQRLDADLDRDEVGGAPARDGAIGCSGPGQALLDLPDFYVKSAIGDDGRKADADVRAACRMHDFPNRHR
jgi:hypothetical protein